MSHVWQGFWRSGLLSHTSCTCRTTGAPGSKASSSSSPLACSSQLWQWPPSSSSSLLPSQRNKVILFLKLLVYAAFVSRKRKKNSMLFFFTQLLLTHGASISPACGAFCLSNGPSSWPCTRIDIVRNLPTSASSVISSSVTI